MSKALFKSTSTVSLMTLFSRVLGFVRDMVAAQVFGVNASVDAFLIAFKIPNFMRNLFAEGSFSQAFVPVLSQYRQQKSHDEVRALISHVTGCLSVILLIVTIIGVLATPVLVFISAPGLDPYRFYLASHMLRITFPYLMMISIAALAGSILNSYGVFSVPALAPSLLNVCFIIAALFFRKYFTVPIESQAWAIFIAGIVQIGFQLPFLKRAGLLPRPRINWQDPGVRRILKLMIPAMFGSSVVQIGLLVNTIFASFLKVGSVTWLYYSERLAYFPLGVFGVALATVILPHLSRQFAKQSDAGFQSALDWGIRCNVIIGLPATITMWLLAGPMVATLFQYGHFHRYDVLMTQKSVIAYAVGLQAFMLVKILSSAFYARQDIKTPVKIAVVMVLFNIILNAILIFPLAHAGLALATSLSSCTNVGLLLFLLYKKNIYRFQAGWGLFSLRLLVANAAIGFWLAYQQGPLAQWLNWHAKERVEHLFFLMISAIILYFVVLWISGLRFKHLRAISEN